MTDERIKILMVCLGNICRSPLAEGILKQKLNPKRYAVQSAGTSNYHIGKLPDVRSINVARKNGIDITDQRAAQFTANDFDTYDYIFAMDSDNYKHIIQLAPNKNAKAKVSLILNEISSKSDSDVPDPYYGGPLGFENVYTLLDTACNIVASRI